MQINHEEVSRQCESVSKQERAGELIRGDKRAKVQNVTDELTLNFSCVSVQRITADLGYHKVFPKEFSIS